MKLSNMFAYWWCTWFYAMLVFDGGGRRASLVASTLFVITMVVMFIVFKEDIEDESHTRVYCPASQIMTSICS